MPMATHTFKDVLMVTDSSRIGPGEFFFKELGSRTVQQVLMTLAVAHLNELPIFNAQKTIYETYGLWDLLPTILDLLQTEDVLTVPLDNAQAYSFKTNLNKKLRNPIASAIAENPGIHPFVPIESHHRLYEVVDTILSNHYTQVSITTDKNVLLNVITVDTLVRFIYVNRLRLHPWYFNTTVEELHLGSESSLCVIRDTAPVIEAFKLMNTKQVSCVAVVDERKHLVGCINLSDMHIIFKPKRSIVDLLLPAIEFIHIGEQLSKGVVPAPFATKASCYATSTLGELVTFAIRNRAWNFILLNKDQSVSRIISSRDILKAFFIMDERLRHAVPAII